MKRIWATAIVVCTALLLASAAQAQVTLNSVRIGAKDTAILVRSETRASSSASRSIQLAIASS